MQQRHRSPAKESSREQPKTTATTETRQRAQSRAALGFGEEQDHAVPGAAPAGCSWAVRDQGLEAAPPTSSFHNNPALISSPLGN